MDLQLVIRLWVYFSILLLHETSSEESCLKIETSITQKIENEGFHREIKWLVETSPKSLESLNETNCRLNLRLDVPRGMYINPDEIADIIRTNNLLAYIEGEVNVETPMHESEEHNFYIFLDNIASKFAISFPMHMRYQRAQITGGYGKVVLHKPSLLVNCLKDVKFCGKQKKLQAPCDMRGEDKCVWKNITYEVLFDDAELYVPIGDQDDYPLVSIVTLLLGCAGTIYILSILSTAPL